MFYTQQRKNIFPNFFWIINNSKMKYKKMFCGIYGILTEVIDHLEVMNGSKNLLNFDAGIFFAWSKTSLRLVK